MKQTIQSVNGSSAVILTEELLNSLKLRPGDNLYITKVENGGLMLTPYDPDLANLIKMYEKFSQRQESNTLNYL
ncbi:hypothetical protein BH10PSE19_BH10PSE19_12020 [soil metagenome]